MLPILMAHHALPLFDPRSDPTPDGCEALRFTIFAPKAIRLRGPDQQLLRNLLRDHTLGNHVAEPRSAPMQALVAIVVPLCALDLAQDALAANLDVVGAELSAVGVRVPRYNREQCCVFLLPVLLPVLPIPRSPEHLR